MVCTSIQIGLPAVFSGMCIHHSESLIYQAISAVILHNSSGNGLYIIPSAKLPKDGMKQILVFAQISSCDLVTILVKL